MRNLHSIKFPSHQGLSGTCSWLLDEEGDRAPPAPLVHLPAWPPQFPHPQKSLSCTSVSFARVQLREVKVCAGTSLLVMVMEVLAQVCEKKVDVPAPGPQ